MLKTNIQEEFKKLSFQLESLEAQRNNTFNLKEKSILKGRIDFILKQIDVLLDEYNQE